LRQEAKDRAAEAERVVKYAADLALLKRVYRRWSAVVVLQVSALNSTVLNHNHSCTMFWLTVNCKRFAAMTNG
jgi:hypothetical protein